MVERREKKEEGGGGGSATNDRRPTKIGRYVRWMRDANEYPLPRRHKFILVLHSQKYWSCIPQEFEQNKGVLNFSLRS